MNDEFVEMTEYVVGSFHDLLIEESESPSDSDSSRGSHHSSRECFMVGTPEGYVESIHEGEATPTNDLDDEVKGDLSRTTKEFLDIATNHASGEEAVGAIFDRLKGKAKWDEDVG